jgi:hypothetical protein
MKLSTNVLLALSAAATSLAAPPLSRDVAGTATVLPLMVQTQTMPTTFATMTGQNNVNNKRDVPPPPVPSADAAPFVALITTKVEVPAGAELLPTPFVMLMGNPDGSHIGKTCFFKEACPVMCHTKYGP